MSDFNFKIVADAANAATSIENVLDGLEDINKAAAKAGGAIEDSFDGAEKAIKQADQATKATQKSLEKMVAVPTKGFFGGMKDAIKGLGETFGPFNQALELAGKGLRFAEAGLDAYAKTSKAAKQEVDALKTEFTKLKDEAMAGVGAVVVGVARPWKLAADAIRDAKDSMKEVTQTEFWNRFYASFEAGKMGKGANAAGIFDAVGGVRQSLDEMFGGVNRFGEVDDLWDKFANGAKKSAEATKQVTKALSESEKEWRKLVEAEKARNIAGTFGTQSVTSPIGRPDFGLPGNENVSQEYLKSASSMVDDQADAIMKANGKLLEARDQQIKAGEEVKEAWARGLGSIAAEFVNAAAQGELSFGKIASQLAKLALQMAAMQMGGPYGAVLSSFVGGLNFAHGGVIMEGRGGTDSQLLAIRKSPNERVTIETPPQVASGALRGGGRSGPTSVVINMQNDRRDIVSGMDSRDGEVVLAKLDRRMRGRRR